MSSRGPLRSASLPAAPCGAGSVASTGNALALPYSATIRVRDACLCLHVQRAARALARRFDTAFRALGVTHRQFSLRMSLNRPEPARMADVAALLAMDRTTLTAALKPLQRRRLATVSIDRDDKRGRRLSLTARGRALLAEALPIWDSEHAALDAQLASSDPQRLRDDLKSLHA